MATIAITGASGFVGAALSRSLRAAGHDVWPVVRAAGSGASGDGLRWDPATGAIDRERFAAVDAVVHLAGENIAAGRWTRARRKAIDASRGPTTERLCRALAELPRPPALLSASAIGIYGDRGHEELTEQSPVGRGWLADVAVRWEAATAPLAEAGARVALLRIGMVLGHGGALGKMLTPFRLGLGGRLGSGRQYVSWIALDDLVAILAFLLERPDVTGPVHCTAPAPVTNLAFTKALGRALRRPTVLPVPAFALRLLLGGMTDALLLSSQRVLPERLTALGYEFRYPDVDAALRAAID